MDFNHARTLILAAIEEAAASRLEEAGELDRLGNDGEAEEMRSVAEAYRKAWLRLVERLAELEAAD